MRFQDISRRLGQFEIDKELIHQFPEAVMEAMGKCVIMRAEYLAAPDRVFYFGHSPMFDALTEPDNIPMYTVMHTPSGVQFRRN